jgi:hypothetical protein
MLTVLLPPIFQHAHAGGETTITGSSVGSSHIKVIILALESARLNAAHKYKHIPEAQVMLCSDRHVCAFELAEKHNELQQADKAHVLKAAGSPAGMSWLPANAVHPLGAAADFFFFLLPINKDTYTEGKLKACSFWCLQSPLGGAQKIFILIWDCASILLSSQTAFCGDSARSLLWSDLFLSKVKLYNIFVDDGYILVHFVFPQTLSDSL